MCVKRVLAVLAAANCYKHEPRQIGHGGGVAVK